MNVLYVEDDPHDADLAQHELARFAPYIKLEVAPTLREARNRLANPNAAYDLVLVDLRLPDGSGLELLEEIRERAQPVAVVILTGVGDEETAVAALKAGADDYVAKRNDYLARLPLTLEAALERFRTETARRTHPLRVLYAEHNAGDIDLIQHHLARYAPHIHLDVVYTAPEVLQRLRRSLDERHPYDVLLLDYRLPSMNALELIKELSQEHGLSLPTVLVTGRGDEEMAVQALRLGAADYVVKNPGYLFKLPVVLENAYYHIQLERERAKLAESEARFRFLAENAKDLIYRYRLKPRPAFEYVSPSATAITGYTPEDYYADPELGFKLVHPEDRPLLAQVASRENLGQPLILRWVRKDGAVIWTEQQNTPIYDENGELVALEGIARDVTRRQQALERLREREASFRLLFENNPHPMWVYDLETLAFLEVNNAAVEHYGYSRDEFLSMRLTDIRPAEDVPHLLDHLQHERPTLQHSGEWRHKLKNGQIIDVEITSHTLEFAGRKAALVVAQDITERKQARLAEREQRELAEALRDSAAALISALDLETVMDTILENVTRVVPHDGANIMLIEGGEARPAYWHGYKPKRIPLLQEFRLSVMDAPNLRQMFTTKSPFLVSRIDQYPDWVRYPIWDWVESYVAAPIQSHGQVIGFLNLDSGTSGFFTETHARHLQAFADQASIAIETAQLYEEIQRHAHELEQRVAERTAELQQSEARYRAIIEDQTDMVCRYLPGGILTFVNQAYCQRFNRTPEELLGTSFFDLFSGEERSELEQRLAALNRQNPVITTETGEITIDGQQHWVHWVDRMLFDEAGNFVEYQAVGRDITERKQAENQLRQMLEHAMRLNEMKSQYTAMAAHDLRNPLAVIRTSLDTLYFYGNRLTEEQRQAKYDRIQISIKVMTDMLDDILTMGRFESGVLKFDPAPLDVQLFCQELVDEVKQSTGAAQDIAFSSQGNCGSAAMDAKLLRHILGNLLSNAIKYSPDGTPVTFSLVCEPDQIAFRIQDCGIGIPQADQKWLFEAFHRASNAKRFSGTGLGLAIVKQSVDLHGGRITFESQEGVGTTFTVVFPRVPLEKSQ